MRWTTVLALLFALAPPACAQHLGARQQWQPETETDARLEQALHTEIAGRALLSGLPLLSAKTGVDLRVAPEDLSALGERKFTVIARGCSLKAVMVQLAVALQECHWDVDASGPEPVYLLHRTFGLDYATRVVQEHAPRADSPEAQAARAAALDRARRVLLLSPEQLDDLRRTDLYLAATASNPEARAGLEAFLGLDPDLLGAFLGAGSVELPYPQAPAAVQQAAARAVQLRIDEHDVWARRGDRSPEAKEQQRRHLQDCLRDLAQSTLTYHGLTEVQLALTYPGAAEAEVHSYVIPPTHTGWSTVEGWERQLVLGTADPAQASPTVAQELTAWVEQGAAADRSAHAAARDARLHQDPHPALQRTVTLPSAGPVTLPELQAAVARDTGLSIVSDFFTEAPAPAPHLVEHPDQPPGQEPEGQPAGLLLGLFSERSRSWTWHRKGEVLVFQHTDWAERSLRELTESWLETYRATLPPDRRAGLEAEARIVASVGPRPLQPDGFAVPQDLLDTPAAVLRDPYTSWFLRFYASLAPAQREAARGPRDFPTRA